MSNNCNPPYKCGTGGFCNCSCGCCPPCPCYLDYTWTYTVNRGMPCSNGNQSFTSDLTYTGCCLTLKSYSISGSILKSFSFSATGAGTISITNAYNDVSIFCGNSEPLTVGMKFGINSYYLTSPGTLTYDADDCEPIQITIVLDVNSCCGWTLDSFGGNKYDESCEDPAPFHRSRKIDLQKKVLARIKKVRYKP